MPSEATIAQLAQTARGLRESIARLKAQGEKDGVDRTETINSEQAQLAALESQIPKAAPDTEHAPAPAKEPKTPKVKHAPTP